MKSPLTLITIALILNPPVNSLLGYDCKGEGLNVTVLSLTDIGECQLENIEPLTEETYVQLLQLSEFDHATRMQCRIKIDRTILYCGMHSHTSSVLKWETRLHLRNFRRDLPKITRHWNSILGRKGRINIRSQG